MAKRSFFVQNWIDFFNESEMKSKLIGKSIYIWDKDKYGEQVSEYLEENRISITGYVSESEDKTDKILEEHPFVIVAKRYSDKEVIGKLIKYGYKRNVDMIYIYNYVEVKEVEGYYNDCCGNEVIVEEAMEGLTLNICGYNNKVHIGRDFWSQDFKMNLKGGAVMDIEEGVAAKNGIMYLHNSKSKICRYSWLGGNFFISNFDGELEIGEEFSALDSLYMCCVENTKLTIGRECMCAKSVKILSGGAHSLFDLTLKENINIRDNVHVTIGEHVWLGMEASVIYNSDIGEHSMVGAKSLVKGKYPDHCVIAGNIAKVVRTNTDWNANDYMSFAEYQELEEIKRKQKR